MYASLVEAFDDANFMQNRLRYWRIDARLKFQPLTFRNFDASVPLLFPLQDTVNTRRRTPTARRCPCRSAATWSPISPFSFKVQMRQEFNIAFDGFRDWPRHVAIARIVRGSPLGKVQAFVLGHEMSHIAFDPVSWFLHANCTERSRPSLQRMPQTPLRMDALLRPLFGGDAHVSGGELRPHVPGSRPLSLEKFLQHHSYRLDYGFRDSNENMADIVGERVAFEVYMDLVKTEPRLPGLVGEKGLRGVEGEEGAGKGAVFFAAIATAPMFCMHQTPANALGKWKQAWQLVGDIHSYGEFRVNGLVRHSHAFAALFGCPRVRRGTDECPSFF